MDPMKQTMKNDCSSIFTNSTYNSSEKSNNPTKKFINIDDIPTDETIILQDVNLNQIQMTNSVSMPLYPTSQSYMTTANYPFNTNNTKILPVSGVNNVGIQYTPMAQMYSMHINQNYPNMQNMVLNNNTIYSNYGTSQYSFNTMLNNDKLIKSQIIEKHAIKFTDLYDYHPNETDKKINVHTTRRFFLAFLPTLHRLILAFTSAFE